MRAGDRRRRPRHRIPAATAVDRRELCIRAHATANADAAIQWYERLRMRLAQAVERRAVLPAQVEQVLETGIRHEGGASPLALEQRIVATVVP